MAIELSDAMRDALSLARVNGGSLYRHPGGAWCGQQRTAGNQVGTATIVGLARRGLLEYCEWAKGKIGPFPVKVQLTNQTQIWFEDSDAQLREQFRVNT